MLSKDFLNQRRKKIRQSEIKMAIRQAKHRLKEMFGVKHVITEDGKLNKDFFQQFSKIKYMRYVKLTTLKVASPEVISDFLFEESMRILNQHSIRLLLEDSSGNDFVRHVEDEADLKALLEAREKDP